MYKLLPTINLTFVTIIDALLVEKKQMTEPKGVIKVNVSKKNRRRVALLG